MSGVYFWGVFFSALFLAAMVVRAVRMAERLDADDPRGISALDEADGVTVRPVPSESARSAAAARVDWDRPAGYSHADAILRTTRK